MNKSVNVVIADITNAFILLHHQKGVINSYIEPYFLIISNSNGTLYLITRDTAESMEQYDDILPYYKAHYNTAYVLSDIRPTDGSIINLIPFSTDSKIKSKRIPPNEYNAILSRIEDIYGMSISEFSLGFLEYEY